jgi:hypothetical protein
MKLPKHLSEQLWKNVVELEKEIRMTYVSTGERIGIEKGIQQGMQAGIQQGEALALQKLLTKRFGAIPAEIAAQIGAASFAQIEVWFDLAIDATSLSAVFGDTPPSTH